MKKIKLLPKIGIVESRGVKKYRSVLLLDKIRVIYKINEARREIVILKLFDVRQHPNKKYKNII